ncbi:MAG: YdcF family protein [Alphaproteobacteria bacterium]|nr:YdcF family protein [Alphaproteobacteria bacterium]
MSFIPNSIQTALLVLLVVLGLALASFQKFVLTLPNDDTKLSAPIDGLVVATGGQLRIQKGVELLAGGKADRMLISGVGKGITKELLKENLAISNRQARFFDCCVEIEFTATDTNGNAQATFEWMQKHALDDILLVSANYHLPRAELIFKQYLPENSVYVQAVNPPDLKLSAWHSNWQTTRLLLKEYLKYIYVKSGLG